MSAPRRFLSDFSPIFRLSGTRIQIQSRAGWFFCVRLARDLGPQGGAGFCVDLPFVRAVLSPLRSPLTYTPSLLENTFESEHRIAPFAHRNSISMNPKPFSIASLRTLPDPMKKCPARRRLSLSTNSCSFVTPLIEIRGVEKKKKEEKLKHWMLVICTFLPIILDLMKYKTAKIGAGCEPFSERAGKFEKSSRGKAGIGSLAVRRLPDDSNSLLANWWWPFLESELGLNEFEGLVFFDWSDQVDGSTGAGCWSPAVALRRLGRSATWSRQRDESTPKVSTACCWRSLNGNIGRIAR